MPLSKQSKPPSLVYRPASYSYGQTDGRMTSSTEEDVKDEKTKEKIKEFPISKCYSSSVWWWCWSIDCVLLHSIPSPNNTSIKAPMRGNRERERERARKEYRPADTPVDRIKVYRGKARIPNTYTERISKESKNRIVVGRSKIQNDSSIDNNFDSMG